MAKISFEGSQAMQAEGIDVPYLLHECQQLVNADEALRRTKFVQGAADGYFEHIGRHIISLTSWVTDHIPFAISDIALAPQPIAKELLAIFVVAGIIGILSSDVSATQKTAELVDTVKGMFIGTGTGFLIFMLTYGYRYFRTPLEQKLGIVKEPFDVTEETAFVISKLNELSESRKLERDEQIAEAHKAVKEFFENYYPPVRTAHRVKKSLFSKMLLKTMGFLGICNPFIQEIISTIEVIPELYAHEFAHANGAAPEPSAQIAGVIAQISSEDPSVQYQGYSAWLYQLISHLISENKFEEILKKLCSAWLNERSLEECKERWNTLEEVYNADNWCRRKERWYRELLLKLTGQEGVNVAYVDAPLALLANWRKQQANATAS
ncbi:DUF3810 family protein [Candidatus Dojkabacteria bacterium]|nr:DUF3810 family protein [Candidatus Dojkabacteria bacterium]